MQKWVYYIAKRAWETGFSLAPVFFFFLLQTYFKVMCHCAPTEMLRIFRFVIVLHPCRSLGFFLPSIYVDIVMTVRKDILYAKGKNRSDHRYCSWPLLTLLQLVLLAKYVFSRPDFNFLFISNLSLSSPKMCFPAGFHPPSTGFEFIKKIYLKKLYFVLKDFKRMMGKYWVSAQKLHVSKKPNTTLKRETFTIKCFLNRSFS